MATLVSHLVLAFLLPLLLSSLSPLPLTPAILISSTCAATPFSIISTLCPTWLTRSFILLTHRRPHPHPPQPPPPAPPSWWLVTGCIPGSLLEVDEFDWVQVTVVGHLLNESMTSVHWRGLHMRVTPFAGSGPGRR